LEQIKGLESAIAQNKTKNLSELLYQAKMILLEVKQDKNSLMLHNLIGKAET
jgi:hypothetical protein